MVCTTSVLLHACMGVAADPIAGVPQHFERFCIDCHDDVTQEGNLDLTALLARPGADRSIVFEHLITGKMPPEGGEQPTVKEKRQMLAWLASHQDKKAPNDYRRISRHEFVHAVNDLLGIRLDVTGDIADDRNTYNLTPTATFF